MQCAEKTYAMPANENLWQAAALCHQILADGDICYTVCGGVAVPHAGDSAENCSIS